VGKQAKHADQQQALSSRRSSASTSPMHVDAIMEQGGSRDMLVGEAATVLNLTESMVRALCRNGKLEHWRDEQRPRRPIVISEASVQALRVRRGAIVDDGTVSPGQAAKMLGISTSTVRHLCVDGTLECRREQRGLDSWTRVLTASVQALQPTYAQWRAAIDDPALLTLDEAARRLNCTPKGVEKLIARGVVETASAYARGHHLKLIRSESVDAYLAQRQWRRSVSTTVVLDGVEYVTVRGAAQRMGLSRQRVGQLIEQGDLPVSLHIPGPRRPVAVIAIADVDALEELRAAQRQIAQQQETLLAQWRDRGHNRACINGDGQYDETATATLDMG